MKPLLVYLQLVGPIKSEEHGTTHQLEFGVKRKDSDKPDSSRILLKNENTIDSLEQATKLLKAFIEKYYPQPKVDFPENIIKLNQEPVAENPEAV